MEFLRLYGEEMGCIPIEKSYRVVMKRPWHVLGREEGGAVCGQVTERQ